MENEWIKLPRTEAIERILIESADPLSPTQLSELLALVSRTDSAHHISAALHHLRTTGRAVTVTRGRWTHPTRIPEPEGEFAEFVPPMPDWRENISFGPPSENDLANEEAAANL